MAISAVQNNPQAGLAAALSGGGGASANSGVQEMSDRFLKLLVTQLKNQDPMNPMENAELTMQLAQMSTVEGVNKLNSSLDALNAQFRATQVIQGASLVGRQVLAEGDALKLGAAGAVAGFDLAGAADKVQVQILDEAGNVAHTLALGSLEGGLNRFVWDGRDAGGTRLADGDYSFKVLATAGDKDVASRAYAVGSVLSVALNDDGMDVEISGLGNRGMEQIKQIY